MIGFWAAYMLAELPPAAGAVLALDIPALRLSSSTMMVGWYECESFDAGGGYRFGVCCWDQLDKPEAAASSACWWRYCNSGGYG